MSRHMQSSIEGYIAKDRNVKGRKSEYKKSSLCLSVAKDQRVVTTVHYQEQYRQVSWESMTIVQKSRRKCGGVL